MFHTKLLLYFLGFVHLKHTILQSDLSQLVRMKMLRILKCNSYYWGIIDRWATFYELQSKSKIDFPLEINL